MRSESILQQYILSVESKGFPVVRRACAGFARCERRQGAPIKVSIMSDSVSSCRKTWRTRNTSSNSMQSVHITSKVSCPYFMLNFDTV